MDPYLNCLNSLQIRSHTVLDIVTDTQAITEIVALDVGITAIGPTHVTQDEEDIGENDTMT